MPVYDKNEVIKGILIYSCGDTAARLILGEFSISRALAVMLVGGGLYALEIPAFFRWIEKKNKRKQPLKRAMLKTVYAFSYFNPLWIVRHLLLIHFLTGHWEYIGWDLLVVGWWSFFWKIPISFLGNYIVQVRIPMKFRFAGSAVLSSLFALYYALSERWFHF